MRSRYELFQNYLEVCNRALELNRARFPFKQVLGAAQKAERERRIQVVIEDSPMTEFIIKIDGDMIKGELKDLCLDCACERKWRVSKKYMEEVVKNPDAYISNPAKLDWDWMFGKNI